MKIAQWLLKTVLTVVLISGLTVLTTGAVVNMYVQSLLASFNIQLEGQPTGIGGMMKGMLGLNTTKEKEPDKEAASTAHAADDSKSTVGSTNTAETGTGSTDGAGETAGTGSQTGTNAGDAGSGGSTAGMETGGNADGEGTDAPDDALPVMGQGLSESAMGGQSAADQQVVISPDEMIQKKDELTATEKEQIFNILMKKLPQSEMQKISAAMEDGLTEQELSTIEDTISKYLTKEEYAALSKLLEQ
ncbi:hypothetical protein BK138_20225 [Paenibacillus rhizosphaerae]|uniref:Spore coat protein n=1 Tax=Paenibacillus rhizosphaerae TaxID=297318 RepID=A0A1R1EN28_9BACL|nr:hypothetical protein [Paenibacillus rhizosphaerae]OMF53221.1 hypothetical protein BK138_20225 [Paenibacillus rhizosphaerae]